jgi:hypothetical protein
MYEYSGNLHMHTPYSDGAKWHHEIANDAISAGLDFIIVTDHNIWVDGLEGYYESELGRILLLVGEEIHDPRRTPQANHFLAYGAEKELSIYANSLPALFRKTRENGGHGFLAHPFDPAAPSIGEGSLEWQDWEIEGYSGLEIWNYMSEFKGLLGNKLRNLKVALNPEKYISGPDPRTLARWDELLSQGKRLVAIGSSDAHGLTYKLGPIRRIIFPYQYLFRTVNTHILVKEELNGSLAHDKQIILESIGKGNCWVGYDLPQNTGQFRFSGQSKTKGIMGDQIRLGAGATLQVKTPNKCRIRLVRDGAIVAECDRDDKMTHLPVEAGTYRVECYIRYLGKERGWIFSNPIYLI